MGTICVRDANGFAPRNATHKPGEKNIFLRDLEFMPPV